jgi:hypothetical protein
VRLERAHPTGQDDRAPTLAGGCIQLKETSMFRLPNVVLLVSLVGVVLIALLVSAASGMNPWDNGHNYSRPACDQLQDQQTVADALASRQDLVARLEAIGSGVTVTMDTPCDDQPDRALVSITYSSDAEWDGIQSIMSQESFGVGVDVVED